MQIENTYAAGEKFYLYPLKAKEKLSDYSKLQPAITRLKAFDSVVRIYKVVHMAAGGGAASGETVFGFLHGLDGKMYAVGDKMGIDTTEVHTPEATIIAAAPPSANPSPQDYKVVSTALIMQQWTQLEIMKETQTKLYGNKRYIEVSINTIYERLTIDKEITHSSVQNGELQAG